MHVEPGNSIAASRTTWRYDKRRAEESKTRGLDKAVDDVGRLSFNQCLDVPDKAEFLDLVRDLPDFLEPGNIQERHVVIVAEHGVSALDASYLRDLVRVHVCLGLQHHEHDCLHHVYHLTPLGTRSGFRRSPRPQRCRCSSRSWRSWPDRGPPSPPRRPTVRGRGTRRPLPSASLRCRRPSSSSTTCSTLVCTPLPCESLPLVLPKHLC